MRIALLAAVALVLPGCGKQPASPEVENAKPKVALIMKSLANEFFVRMADGAREHSMTNADKYELIVNGTKDESDLTQQVALVEQMMATGADVIVIAPADSKALIPVIKRAMISGIVVVNIDNKLDTAVLEEVGIDVPFVGPDNREGARIVGDYLGATLSPGDQAAIISGISTAYNAQQRERGFEDAMSAAGMDIVSVQNGDWDQAKASTITAALITEYPNLRAILCGNDNMAIGAIAALRQAGKSGAIKVVGFDNIAAVHPLLSDGSLTATADQYAAQLAIYGIEYALEILTAGKAPADKKTPVTLVTRADLLMTTP